MSTIKQIPLLEEIRIMLEAALFHLSEGNLLDVEELLGDAIGDTNEAITQIQGAREDAARMAGRVTLDTELLDMLAPKESVMSRVELLNWTLEKNGLADAMAELAADEQPTDAMQKAISEIEAEPPTLAQILAQFADLDCAYHRLRALDLNGACCAATDILEAFHYGGGIEVADELAQEINAMCDEILSRE
jgi:hypothetical protein